MGVVASMQRTAELVLLVAVVLFASACDEPGGACPPGDGLGSWSATTREGSPVHRHHHATVYERTTDRVIIWGGAGDTAELADGAIYNPRDDTWEALPTEGAPSARTQFAHAFTGRYLVIFGGMRRVTSEEERPGEILGDGAILDVTTLTWSPLPVEGIPPPRYRAAATAVGARVFVVGGLDADGVRGDAHVLDLGAVPPAWRGLRGAPPLTTSDDPLPYAAEPLFLSHNDVALVAISGVGTGGPTMRAAVYPLGAGIEVGGPWSVDDSPQAPPARSGAVMVTVGGGRFMVYGGHAPHLEAGDDARQYIDDGALLTVTPGSNAMTWEQVTGVDGVSVPRAYAGGVWTGDGLMVVGGRDPGHCGGGVFWDYNSRQWTRLTYANGPRAGRFPGVAWTGVGLVVFGGMRPLTQSTLGPVGGVWRP
ncbi:MAG: hypothetical protein AB2A00_37445 [Myxococcota bacterium]